MYENLDDLLETTLNRIIEINNISSKTGDDAVLVSLYKAVKLDFEHNLDLMMLNSDYKLVTKQAKFMLRATKRLRVKSWKLTFMNMRDNYYKNKLDMFNFNYDCLVDQVRDIKLFDDNKVMGMYVRNKNNIIPSEEREPSDNSNSKAVTEQTNNVNESE